MIFKIADGRECFYQWDIDRQLIVSDPTITEVHFCNRTDVCSLVVEVVDGVANVPNKLLQSGFDVRVFGYDGKATMHEATFKVKARTQPADYVYTETVVKSIEEILEAAETVTTTANEFYEFVEDHTLGLTDDGEGNVELVAVDAEESVDLTDYYTKTEVNELIENIDIPETDLTGYATEEYVDAAVKNVEVDESKFASKDHSHAYSSLTGKPVIPSIEGLASEEYVDEAVKNAKPDLTGYATEKYVDDAIAAIDISDVSNLNDVVYVDSTMDSDDIKNIIRNEQKWPVYVRGKDTANPTFLPLVYKNGEYYYFGNNYKDTYYSIVYNGYDEVWGNLETKTISGGGSADLSNYYTKEETYSKTEVNGLIPEPTDLTNYYTKAETDDAINTGLIDIYNNYYSKEEVDDLINNIEIPEGGGGTGGAGTPLYQHTVYIGADGKFSGFRDPSAYATFVCDRAEEFTFESFVNYLNTTGATLAISGTVVNSTSTPITYPLDIMKANSAGTGLVVSYRSTTDSSSPRFDSWTITSTELTNFTDTVSLIGTASVSGGGNVDLRNYYTKTEADEIHAEIDTSFSSALADYYTKDETTQAIQDALNAIGVAEGGAY